MSKEYDEGYEDAKGYWLFCAFVGLIGGLIILLLVGVFIIEPPLRNDIEELGGSICEEEHNSSFVSYYKEVLVCESKLVSYDGIMIEVIS